MDRNIVLTALIGTIAVTSTITIGAWQAGEPLISLTVVILGSAILLVIISWKAGKIANQFVTDFGEVKDLTTDLDDDFHDIKGDLSDIKGNTDDLYNGIIKVMDDLGIDFVEMVSDSVKYNLKESGVEAVISFGSVDKGDETTEITIRFNEGVVTDSVFNELVEDESLYEREKELFGDNRLVEDARPGEPHFGHRGGGQVLEAHIPSTDDEAISEWVKLILNRLDSLYAEQHQHKQEFEDQLMESLEGSEKV